MDRAKDIALESLEAEGAHFCQFLAEAEAESEAESEAYFTLPYGDRKQQW